MKTNNLTVRPLSIVTKILYDKDKKKATGVEVLDASDNKTYEFKSKIVFVCASALNSTWMLFNSATDVFPEGLGSSSGELGHNVMDHHYNLGVSGEIEGYEDKYSWNKVVVPVDFIFHDLQILQAIQRKEIFYEDLDTRAAPAGKVGEERSQN